MNRDSLSELFGAQIGPFLDSLSKDLKIDIKVLEARYGIPISSLGNSFDVSTAKVSNFSLGSQPKFDPTGGLSEGLSKVVAVIAGIVAAVSTPFIIGIVIGIVAVISQTLAVLIFTILFSTPGGWPVLAAIGIVGIAAGGKAKEVIEERLPNWDLPVWVRSLVNENSVYSKIDSQRKGIISQITSKLRQDEQSKKEITKEISTIFERSLKNKAEKARIFIS